MNHDRSVRHPIKASNGKRQRPVPSSSVRVGPTEYLGAYSVHPLAFGIGEAAHSRYSPNLNYYVCARISQIEMSLDDV